MKCVSFKLKWTTITQIKLNSCGTQVRLPGVAYSSLQGFMNFVHSKLPNIIKSFVIKSLSKFVGKCFGIGLQIHTFFENIHGTCKHLPILVFHIVLGNVYIMFKQCKTFFVFAFTHCHVAHSSILSIALYNFVLHVLISNKCQKGTSQVSSLKYSKGFFVISHILSNKLEINVYSITNSNLAKKERIMKIMF